MKYLAIFIINLFLFSLPLIGQTDLLSKKRSKKYLKKYYQEQLNPNWQLEKVSYNYTLEKTPKGQWVKQVFYPETRQITHVITYADALEKVKQSSYKEWYDNGQIWIEGQYQNNQKTGEWKYYDYSTQKLKDYGVYQSDKKEGIWITLNKKGQRTCAITYQKGKKEGAYKEFDKQGEVAILSIYAQDTLVSGDTIAGKIPLKNPNRLVSILPHLKGCTNIDLEAQKECSDKKLLATIYQNIRYPMEARRSVIEGMAIINFVVEKDGSMTDIRIKRGLCAAIEAECRKVVKLLSIWEAGVEDGEKVRVQFNLPVKFRLEY